MEATRRSSHLRIFMLMMACAGISLTGLACASGTTTDSIDAVARTMTESTTKSNTGARLNAPPTVSATDTATPNETTLTPQPLRAKSNGEIVVSVALPEGYHLNEEAPQRYDAAVTSGIEHIAFSRDARTLTRTAKSLELPLRLPLTACAAGAANVRVSFKVFYCRLGDGGSCRVKTLTWNVPVEVTAESDAPSVINLRSEITL
jgi:hypothetical protein